MTFVVLPASIPEIREVYDAYFAAFEGELVTEVLFPWDVNNNEFREGHTNHTLGYWHKDNVQYTFKCIDTESGEIVGMSLWDVYWRERSEDERRLPAVDWLQGQQKERAQKFIQAFWEKKEALVGGKKHVCKLIPIRYGQCSLLALHRLSCGCCTPKISETRSWFYADKAWH